MTSRISARRSAQATFLLLLALATLVMVVLVLPIWKPLLIAAVLVAVLDPVNRRLKIWLRGRAKLAAAISTVLLIVVVLIPLAVLTVIGVSQAIEAIDFVRTGLQRGGVEGLIHQLPDRIEQPLRDVMAMMPASVPSQVGSQISFLISRMVGIVGSILFALILMLIAFYVLLLRGADLRAWLCEISPLPETAELFHEFRRVGVSVIRSAFVTALVQGILATVGYTIISLPNAIFFGVLTFFAALIPTVGTSLVAIPIIALLVLGDQIWQPIFVAIWFLACVGLVDNLLNPMLMRGGTHLHGVVIFFSLIGGIAMFGAVGILVGPLVVTFFLAMVRFGYRAYLQPS